jgi:hypothetical protein
MGDPAREWSAECHKIGREHEYVDMTVKGIVPQLPMRDGLTAAPEML